MELSEHLKGRVRVLVAVPLITALAAVAIFAFREREVEASATISIVNFSAESADQFTVGPRVDDFVLVLSSSPVIDAVAAAIGEDAAAVKDRFNAIRSGSGPLVLVSFSAPDESAAVDGLEVGIRSALLSLYQADLDRASIALSAAERQRDESALALQQIEERVGGADLVTDYRTRSSDVLQLRNTIAGTVDNPPLAAALNTILREKESELEVLGQEILAWQDAQRRLESASSARDSAQRTVFEIEALRDRTTESPIPAVTSVSTPSIITTVALPTLAAATAAFGAILLWAVATGSREPSPADE